MTAEPDVARIARTIGDPTRIRMLALLMDGRALTAKELAYGSGVEPATGTVHLRKLLDDSLVVSASQGRHKYFRLASPHVAHCIESLMVIARPTATPDEKLPPIRVARFCYDHLAGCIATQMLETFLSRKQMRVNGKDLVLSKDGERWFEKFGVDLDELSHSRRKFAHLCLDWSERKDHLGGALGAALVDRMMEGGWLKRNRDSRVASLTADGRRALVTQFDIQTI